MGTNKFKQLLEFNIHYSQIMKFDIVFLIIIILLMLKISSCANISQPQGGPMDTIPPQLLTAIPSHSSLNFEGQEVELTFNEFIAVEDINNKLIITPRLEENFEYKLNKKTISVLFPNPPDSNTTYTLNFTESVIDITEGNPAEDLVIAFSTGNYIDSLSISGNVKELYTNKAVEAATVAIYKAADTLDIFNSKPDYFTRTNEEGAYLISNIKNGTYKLYAYNDKNQNLKVEPLSESYGFISEPIELNNSIDSIPIPIQKLDVREFKIQSARPDGKYYQIKFNKYVEDYTLSFTGNDSLPSNLVDKSQTVRIYNSINLKDSIEASISAIDTIGQVAEQHFYIKFPETKRSKADLTVAVNPESNEKIEEDFTGTITFSKPIAYVNDDSIFFQYDSLTIDPLIPAEDFTWNKFRDQLTFNKGLDKALLDKPNVTEQTDTAVAPVNINDTLINTTEDQSLLRGEGRPARSAPIAQQQGLKLYFAKGSFVTVDNDTVPTIEKVYNFKNPEDYAIINGNIDTDKESYIVQLLDNNFKVIREIKNQKKYTLTNVPPGEYSIRILIDNNNNGIWEPGNIKENIAPEDIIFYPEIISLRANWELEDVNLSF